MAVSAARWAASSSSSSLSSSASFLLEFEAGVGALDELAALRRAKSSRIWAAEMLWA